MLLRKTYAFIWNWLGFFWSFRPPIVYIQRFSPNRPSSGILDRGGGQSCSPIGNKVKNLLHFRMLVLPQMASHRIFRFKDHKRKKIEELDISNKTGSSIAFKFNFCWLFSHYCWKLFCLKYYSTLFVEIFAHLLCAKIGNFRAPSN